MPSVVKRARATGVRKRPAVYIPSGHDPPALSVARRLHKHGRFAEAIDAYEVALLAAPDNVDVLLNYGSLLSVLGAASSARPLLARACTLANTNVRVLRDAGIAYWSLGDDDVAVARLEESASLDPSHVGVRLWLVRCLLESGHEDRAASHAAEVVRLAPRDPSAWIEHFRVGFSDRAPGVAVESSRRALLLSPSDSYACMMHAMALSMVHGDHASVLGRCPIDPALLDGCTLAIEAMARGARAFASTRKGLAFAMQSARGEGDVLEFGVRHGRSTRLLAALHPTGTVHAFDSFLGLPESFQGRAPGAFSTTGEVPSVPANVRVHCGLFADTLPGFLSDARGAPRLVHIDSDLYESAREVLSHIGPRLRAGAVVLFDEYLGNRTFRDDELRAWEEATRQFRWAYDTLLMDWVTGQAAFRLR